MSVRAVLWCVRPGCGTQIVGYGFADAANPPTGFTGPWLCLFCAAEAARERPDDITQAFITQPVKPGSVWTFSRAEPLRPLIWLEDEVAALTAQVGPMQSREGKGQVR